MALYQITTDCRIANKDYKKWDVVSNEEVGGYFPTVMQPANWAPKKPAKVEKPAKADEPQAPADDGESADTGVADAEKSDTTKNDDAEDGEDEEKVEKPAKAWSKKK